MDQKSEQVQLTITPAQAAMLEEAKQAAEEAQRAASVASRELSLVFGAVLRGHGHTAGNLMALSGTTLVVEVPAPAEPAPE